MTRPTVLKIDLAAIHSNVYMVKKRASRSKLLACVKADAYGHGLIAVASAIASKVDAFGVANLEEAMSLRNAGIEVPILLLEGVFDPAELSDARANELWITVHSQYQLEMLQTNRAEPAIDVWLKMDTGMHRLGFSPSAYAKAYADLIKLDSVSEIIHMTHFACADEIGNEFTNRQLDVFTDVVTDLPGEKSAANSAAILTRQDAHMDWVRPGFVLYGANPFSEPEFAVKELKPAMEFTSAVIAVREIASGEAVGYNQAWRAARDTRIAVVAVGYGDGYPRNTANGTPVLVAGQRAHTVGHVAMDMMLVDITDLTGVDVGMSVELWGKSLAINEVAASSGFSPYELMTRLTGRVPRICENQL